MAKKIKNLECFEDTKAALIQAADGLSVMQTALDQCQSPQLKKRMEEKVGELKDLYLRLYEQRYVIPNIYIWDLTDDWDNSGDTED